MNIQNIAVNIYNGLNENQLSNIRAILSGDLTDTVLQSLNLDTVRMALAVEFNEGKRVDFLSALVFRLNELVAERNFQLLNDWIDNEL